MNFFQFSRLRWRQSVASLIIGSFFVVSIFLAFSVIWQYVSLKILEKKKTKIIANFVGRVYFLVSFMKKKHFRQILQILKKNNLELRKKRAPKLRFSKQHWKNSSSHIMLRDFRKTKKNIAHGSFVYQLKKTWFLRGRVIRPKIGGS
jgi:hypothetical protein